MHKGSPILRPNCFSLQPSSLSFATEILGTFRSENEEVYEFSVLSTRIRFGGRHFSKCAILVPRGRAPFGQHQESRPLAKSNTGSPRFTDFPSLCACSESSLTNLIGSGLNLLCLLSHSKTECRWTRPEVAILGADQKERCLWGREWKCACSEQKPRTRGCPRPPI